MKVNYTAPVGEEYRIKVGSLTESELKDLRSKRIQVYSSAYNRRPIWEGTVTYTSWKSGDDFARITAKNCVSVNSNYEIRKDSRWERKSDRVYTHRYIVVLEDLALWTLPEGKPDEPEYEVIDAEDIQVGDDILAMNGPRVRGIIHEVRNRVPGVAQFGVTWEAGFTSTPGPGRTYSWTGAPAKSEYYLRKDHKVRRFNKPAKEIPDDVDKRAMLEAYFEEQWNKRKEELFPGSVIWSYGSVGVAVKTAVDIMLELIGE